MEDETTKNTSMKCFLKCWCKESKKEYRKWLIYGLYGIAAIIGLFVVSNASLWVYSISSPVGIQIGAGALGLLSIAYGTILRIGSAILSFLFGIAWYWYAGGIVLSIPALIAAGKCVLRKYPEEDILKIRETLGMAIGIPGLFITMIGGGVFLLDLIFLGMNVFKGTGFMAVCIGFVILMVGCFISPDLKKKEEDNA